MNLFLFFHDINIKTLSECILNAFNTLNFHGFLNKVFINFINVIK